MSEVSMPRSRRPTNALDGTNNRLNGSRGSLPIEETEVELERWISPHERNGNGADGFVSTRKARRKKMLTNELWRSKRNTLILVFLYRVISVFLVTTEFVPDEAWQSTEVAYKLTYGRGHLTWEWTVGLRSYIYPMLISGIFRVLRFFAADSPYMLIIAPRLFQAIVSAVGDYAFFLYCCKKYGLRSAKWSVMCLLTCWFMFYTGSRTITNTTEMSLNCIAMYLLEIEQIAAFSGVVGLNFAIRATALVIWIPQAHTIFRHFFPRKVLHRIPACIWFGVGTLLAVALLDWKMYGRPTLPWYRFVKFNFLEGKSDLFGVHHPLWYFYSGLPSIIGPNLIMLAVNFKRCMKLHSGEWIIVIFFMFCFSLIGHKEIRFLLPVLPYVFSVFGNMFAMASKIDKRFGTKKEQAYHRRNLIHTLGVCFLAHFIATAYFSGFHQGAIKPATDYINTASLHLPNPDIWVMMSCYAVPVFTYMHRPSAHFEYMTCGPGDMGLEEHMPNFRRYTTNPMDLKVFVEEKTAAGLNLPDFVLCFDEISATLINVFNELDAPYTVCFSRLHAQIGDERGMVNVLCKQKSTSGQFNDHLPW